jgi:hypothetical protein
VQQNRKGNRWDFGASHEAETEVTLDKPEKTVSPTTRYEDFALSPSQFHWQSQSTRSESSPTGQRYFGIILTPSKGLLRVWNRTDDSIALFHSRIRLLPSAGYVMVIRHGKFGHVMPEILILV